MVQKETKMIGLAFMTFSLLVVGVSAYVYQLTTLTITQNIVEIATITVQNSALGDINEGETIAYTKATVATLGEAVTIDIQSQPVYLYFDSDIDSLSSSYDTYTVTVKFIEVQGSTYSIGATAATMTIGSPDPSAVTLDATGLWKFDFEITTTTESVDADTPTTATIIVSAQST